VPAKSGEIGVAVAGRGRIGGQASGHRLMVAFRR
jgi:hypothetical protein